MNIPMQGVTCAIASNEEAQLDGECPSLPPTFYTIKQKKVCLSQNDICSMLRLLYKASVEGASVKLGHANAVCSHNPSTLLGGSLYKT